jgi:hypothetical protein
MSTLLEPPPQFFILSINHNSMHTETEINGDRTVYIF